MSTFTWVPDVSTRGRRVPRVLKAQFGDGYEQRTQDGLNSNLMVWNLTFSTLTLAELDAIDAFLLALGGADKFQWTPPNPFNDSARWWVCENWSWNYNFGVIVGLTAEFLERPQL